MIGLERVEDQMNIDFLFRLVDDIVGPQFDVGKEYLRTIAISLSVFGNGSEVAIGGEVIRDAERLHVGLMQPSAILVPQFGAVRRAELIVLLRSGRVEVEIPLSPLRAPR